LAELGEGSITAATSSEHDILDGIALSILSMPSTR